MRFARSLMDSCERLASLPGLLGRARPELRESYRSVAHQSYVIFFRYVDGVEPREVLEVIHILHGARDIDAYFDARGPSD